MEFLLIQILNKHIRVYAGFFEVYTRVLARQTAACFPRARRNKRHSWEFVNTAPIRDCPLSTRYFWKARIILGVYTYN